MKKMFIALILLTSLNLYSHAQATPAQTPPAKAKKPATPTTAPKTAPTAAVSKTATSATATKTKTAGPTKKDGTADMRYKSNKDAAKAAPATTHTKKDGTAD